MSHTNYTTLPLLAVRDVVVYPHMQIALFVGREQSINATSLAQNEYDDHLFVVSQKDSLSEDISTDNLHEFGTLCRVVSTMPHDSDDNCLKVLIEGISRARIDTVTQAEDCFMASFHHRPITHTLSDDDVVARKTVLTEFFGDYAEANLRNARELVRVATRIEDLLELMYFIATRVSMPLDDKQKLLDNEDIEAIYTHSCLNTS